MIHEIIDSPQMSQIVIGGWGNTRTVINKNGIRLAEAIEYNILNEKKPVKIIVEMSTGG